MGGVDSQCDDADLELIAVPSEIAPLFRATYIPLSKHLCAHEIFDTSRARERLGYRDVVNPGAAIVESVAWYLENPVELSLAQPTFVDRFDYALEDALIDQWKNAVAQILTVVPQDEVEEVHPMPHPKQPKLSSDERSR